jgi:hypothetical protein
MNTKKLLDLKMENSENLSNPETSSIKGRSVFSLEMTAQGVMVQTAFLTEEGQVLQMPAVFPTVDYAYSQIDELRRLVSEHFAQAALVGAQVIATQSAQQRAIDVDEGGVVGQAEDHVNAVSAQPH